MGGHGQKTYSSRTVPNKTKSKRKVEEDDETVNKRVAHEHVGHGGLTSQTRRLYKGHNYLVREGNRGGKYILVEGIKIYLGSKKR